MLRVAGAVKTEYGLSRRDSRHLNTSLFHFATSSVAILDAGSLDLGHLASLLGSKAVDILAADPGNVPAVDRADQFLVYISLIGCGTLQLYRFMDARITFSPGLPALSDPGESRRPYPRYDFPDRTAPDLMFHPCVRMHDVLILLPVSAFSRTPFSISSRLLQSLIDSFSPVTACFLACFKSVSASRFHVESSSGLSD